MEFSFSRLNSILTRHLVLYYPILLYIFFPVNSPSIDCETFPVRPLYPSDDRRKPHGVSWELDVPRTHFDAYRSGKIGMQRRQPLRHRRNPGDII